MLKSARFWSSSASCHHTPRSIQRIVRAMSSSTMNATAAVEAAAADTKAAEAVRKRAAGLALYEAKKADRVRESQAAAAAAAAAGGAGRSFVEKATAGTAADAAPPAGVAANLPSQPLHDPCDTFEWSSSITAHVESGGVTAVDTGAGAQMIESATAGITTHLTATATATTTATTATAITTAGTSKSPTPPAPQKQPSPPPPPPPAAALSRHERYQGEFDANGFITLQAIIPEETVRTLNERLERVLRGEFDTGHPPDKRPVESPLATDNLLGNT